MMHCGFGKILPSMARACRRALARLLDSVTVHGSLQALHSARRLGSKSYVRNRAAFVASPFASTGAMLVAAAVGAEVGARRIGAVPAASAVRAVAVGIVELVRGDVPAAVEQIRQPLE